MDDRLMVFEEPRLEFRYGQQMTDPRHGLSLFGPYDTDMTTKSVALGHIIIGTEGGIGQFRAWAKALNGPITSAPRDNHRLWPPYPGFEAAFALPWPSDAVRIFALDDDQLLTSSRLRDKHERAYEVVNLYLEGLRIAKKLDERIGVAVCVVPEEVWQNCRPLSYVANSVGPSLPPQEQRARRAGQYSFLQDYDPAQYSLSPDFRRQLKARAMEYDIPVQIIREPTLRLSDDVVLGQRRLTPLSDRMWNLGTALYYKCGGKPWRLLSARDGVCYIGIAFRRTDSYATACCAAQMFLNNGDGVVFLGEFGPWYSAKDNQFHLSESAARNLLAGVLETYRELEGKELTEIFLHSRSYISSEEFRGYQAACPTGVRLVGVRVQAIHRGATRLFRIGDKPILRGTFWRLNERSGYLWGSGFKPSLGTYDGWEVPLPLRIDVQYGDAPVERVAQDILGLTKLNYNSGRLSDGEPVTVGFSDAVGEILISNPNVTHRKANFKFYI
jgi:hypothetical protein